MKHTALRATLGALSLLSLLVPLVPAPAWAQDRDRGVKVVADGTWVRQSDLAEVGDYYALVIGIDTYKDFAPLRCAVRDAKAVADVLRTNYGFKEVVLLLNDEATDDRIRKALTALRRKVQKRDSVLMYYAGHGSLDGTGYWLPVNARQDSDENNLLHTEVREKVSVSWLPARHVLVVCDSCYAGAMFRDAEGPKEVTPPYVQEAVRRASRQCMTSGGLYPVPDGAATGHSVFARYFLKALQEPPRDAFVPSDIFPDLKLNVSVNSPRVEGQVVTPILGVLAEAGHERGGEFVFFRCRRSDEGDKAEAERRAAERRAEEQRRAEEAAKAEAKRKEEERRRLMAVPPWAKVNDEQKRAAAEAGVPAAREVDLGGGERLRLVFIPPGEFTMGDTLSPEVVDRRWPGGKIEWYQDAHPRHRVRLTRGFHLGMNEVTRGQFGRFVQETGYKTDGEKEGKSFALKDNKWGLQDGANWRNPLFTQTDSHPVVCVSWNDAKAFCEWLSGKAGATCRLPTEAEWEYACRAGTETTWWWGDEEQGAQGKANVAGEGEQLNWTLPFKGVRDGYTYTAAAGTFAPNGFGLYDMIGNVWEWCEDWYGADYYGKSPAEDPQGPDSGQYRVLRGGAWGVSPRGRPLRAPRRERPWRPEHGHRVPCCRSGCALRPGRLAI